MDLRMKASAWGGSWFKPHGQQSPPIELLVSRILSTEKQWLQRYLDRAPPTVSPKIQRGFREQGPQGMDRHNLRWMEVDSGVGTVTVTGICRVLLAMSVDLCWK